MFKFQEDSIAILGICTEAPERVGITVEQLDFHTAHTGKRGIDMLRMLSFDLLLIGVRLPDMPLWDLLKHLKTAWPHQKWALVGGPITDQQEITARSFGALTFFDSMPSTQELVGLMERLRERATSRVLSNRFNPVTAPIANPSKAST